MRAGGQDSLRWAIKGATYFDHDTHRFIAGDLEIDGAHISAIKPAGTSTLARALDAQRHVCTPGLVGAPLAPLALDVETDRLIERGVTTAALFLGAASECVRAMRRTQARLYFHLLLNELSRARTPQRATCARPCFHEIRIFQRLAAQVARHGGRLLPAIDCAGVLSAHELIYARRFAAALGLKLAFVLSDSVEAARAFRERFYCTEVQLLAFLQVLRPDSVVWGLAQLTRDDRRILRESGARAVGLPHTAADADVDAITVLPAAALDDPTCGRIAPGMRADLCLFSTVDLAPPSSGSESFLRLFEAHSPDAVLIAGKLVGGSLGATAPSDAAVPPLRLVGKGRADSYLPQSSALVTRLFL
jgi:cytosine/adenosine deaminase-related metal-dependent hydrolase